MERLEGRRSLPRPTSSCTHLTRSDWRPTPSGKLDCVAQAVKPGGFPYQIQPVHLQFNLPSQIGVPGTHHHYFRETSTSEFLNNPLQDPLLHSRIDQHQGYFDLSGSNICNLAPPLTIFRERARFHYADRWKANLPVLERTLMLGASGSEGIK